MRDALTLSSACPQQDNPEAPGGSINEDCLYLNVTTPVKKAGDPGQSWCGFPGGGFFSGAGTNYGHRSWPPGATWWS